MRTSFLLTGAGLVLAVAFCGCRTRQRGVVDADALESEKSATLDIQPGQSSRRGGAP